MTKALTTKEIFEQIKFRKKEYFLNYVISCEFKKFKNKQVATLIINDYADGVVLITVDKEIFAFSPDGYFNINSLMHSYKIEKQARANGVKSNFDSRYNMELTVTDHKRAFDAVDEAVKGNKPSWFSKFKA